MTALAIIFSAIALAMFAASTAHGFEQERVS